VIEVIEVTNSTHARTAQRDASLAFPIALANTVLEEQYSRLLIPKWPLLKCSPVAAFDCPVRGQGRDSDSDSRPIGQYTGQGQEARGH